jgi:hypothetical protein
MKWSTRILLTLGVLLVGGMVISNLILKEEYDKVDKTDMYWNYEKVSEQPFKFIKIEGGNITHIAYEQSPNYSVRVISDWQRYHEKFINTSVKNDTLIIRFIYSPKDMGETNWMKWTTFIRIFSPELLSVQGFNTNFEMFKLKQKNLAVDMSGRSKFEVESFIPDLDTLKISQKDSSEVVFEMSPEYKKPVKIDAPSGDKVRIKSTGTISVTADIDPIKSPESMNIKSVTAALNGYSLLDLGHAQIDSLKLHIADSSAIILSGGALKNMAGRSF